MAVARYYEEQKNPNGATIHGVPLRDLSDDEFEALPEYLQRSVDACDFYRKTKPSSEQKPAAKAEAKPAAKRAPAPKQQPRGGPIKAGQPVLVGEHRPELEIIIPPDTGTVTPADPKEG